MLELACKLKRKAFILDLANGYNDRHPAFHAAPVRNVLAILEGVNMQVPWLSKRSIALKATKLAEDFQRKAGYTVNPPIPVDEIIERSLGLNLCYIDLERILGRGVLGATYANAKLVCINERLFEDGSEGRLVFTCAHEAGHWVLHLPYVNVQDRHDSSGAAIVCRLKDAREPIEWQADYFASCLLMPEKAMREAFENLCGPEPIVMENTKESGGGAGAEQGPFLEQWPYIAAAMCEAGGFSNVSKQAMVIRLQDLGLLVNKTGAGMDWQTLLGE